MTRPTEEALAAEYEAARKRYDAAVADLEAAKAAAAPYLKRIEEAEAKKRRAWDTADLAHYRLLAARERGGGP